MRQVLELPACSGSVRLPLGADKWRRGRYYTDVIRVEQKLKEGREEGRLRRIEGCRWRPPTSGFAESRPWPAVSKRPSLPWGSRGRRFESARPDKSPAQRPFSID